MKSDFSRILALKCARFLLAGGAVILACVRPACAAPQTTGGSIIVDYGDAGYSESGTWENARDTWEEHGSSYSLTRQTAEVKAWAQWRPALPPGEYVVDLWNLPVFQQDSKAQVDITHVGGKTTLQRDMRDGHYGWMRLGKFRFDGGFGDVKITRGDRALLVDSARFRPAASVKAVSTSV